MQRYCAIILLMFLIFLIYWLMVNANNTEHLTISRSEKKWDPPISNYNVVNKNNLCSGHNTKFIPSNYSEKNYANVNFNINKNQNIHWANNFYFDD